MEPMTDLLHFIACRLFEIDAVRFSEDGYRLAVHEQHPAAPLSPFYIDLRLLRSYPHLLSDAAALMVSSAPRLWGELELVSDVPVASTPFVTLISQRTGVPMISPRLTPKCHGLDGEILGAWLPGQRVGVVDDLRTTGGSKEQVIALYTTNGLKVVAVAALIDRGSPEGIEVAGRPFFSVYRWSRLLQFYQQERLATADVVRACERYPRLLAEHLAVCRECA